MIEKLLFASVVLTCAYTTKAQVNTFSYTGTEQTYTVPVGVNAIQIETFGAEGMSSGTVIGGAGGYASGVLAVTPGQLFYVYVGGQNGYNGGGIGGANGAGNGGGASDVRFGGNTVNDRIIVAGGGGGAGATGCEGTYLGGSGGDGGGGNGANGTDSPDGGGGFGGVVGAGGAAGIGCSGFLGQAGLADGTGGNGQSCCCFSVPTVPGGGGGGGGYAVGGGGGGGSAGTVGCSGNNKGGGGGGAGGTSFTGTLLSASTIDGFQFGDGSVVITEICIPTSVTPDVANLPAINGICSADTVSAPTASNECGDVISGTPDVTFPVTAVGTTVVTWTYQDGSGNSATQTQNVIISGVDTGVSNNGGVLTASASGVTYQWVDCDNAFSAISGATSQSYTPTQVTGNYAVVIDDNGCLDTSSCVLVDFTGLEELVIEGKELVQIVDLTGRTTTYRPNTPLILIYSDGTRQRIFKLEE